MTFLLTSSHISRKGILCVVNKNHILKFCITGDICLDMHNLFFPVPWYFCVFLSIWQFVPVSYSPCLFLSPWLVVTGASPCSCNTGTLAWVPVGCGCDCTPPRAWTNTNIFGILLTFFSHSCLGCHWLYMWRCMTAVTQMYCYAAVCLAGQTICT